VALSRQSAASDAAAIRGWSGAHDGRRRPGVQRRRAKSTGRARNPRPPEKVQALRSGRSPLHALRWSGAEGATGAGPDAARWGGPFLLWAGIWKRFHMFTTDDPELARSPGRWLELTRGPATVGPSRRRRAGIPDLEMAKATAATVGPEPRQQRPQREKPCRPEPAPR
jgi:hypothetical protein